MSELQDLQENDVVFHRPTEEEWVVKRVGEYADGEGWLEWKGWPPGRAKLDDCEFVSRPSPMGADG